jgi:hypothetical protein
VRGRSLLPVNLGSGETGLDVVLRVILRFWETFPIFGVMFPEIDLLRFE